ncbi:hypothetical protein GCM10023201_11430 [Actinomycetospora corticicola]|uniref:Uncharacterized protein n=1 Tax=Actinomycetospora corticicola TaxID=663602 RepID=A0A7Y9J4G2_9PSEU|nr:hypothetical protein [Actinomycetospora corticicola]NYD35020.1 hypothetical protein [Actinomycetospora corticicola]
MPLSFSEERETGLVAVTLTDDAGEVVQTRVVGADELARIAAAARRAAARALERGEPLFVTLDELIDDPPD